MIEVESEMLECVESVVVVMVMVIWIVMVWWVVNVLSHILRLSCYLCVNDLVVLEVFFVGSSREVMIVKVSWLRVVKIVVESGSPS